MSARKRQPAEGTARARRASETAETVLAPGADTQAALVRGELATPHDVLGARAASVGSESGVVVRVFHPDATAATCLAADGARHVMQGLGAGLFAVFLPGATLPLRYRVAFAFADGGHWERGDPYRFLPTVGEMDLFLFNEGTHRRLWEVMGAHPREIDGEHGVAFALWAPHARRVSVVGDFCRWDGRLLPMRALGASGVFELFVPGVEPGALYKFEILTQDGHLRVKTDPFAAAMERPPETASRVTAEGYVWEDAVWMSARRDRDPTRAPMAVYEVHLGSWRRVPEEGDRPLTYREAAPLLVEHCRRLGFTHVELLPVMEHPFDGSWGYQVTGYFAPTSRHGTPDDFRFLVDTCHRAGIGVILDWVPAHFPKDDFALRRFDGTALYEHEDPRRGEHPDWGTLIFNYGRTEVRSFLLASALKWLDAFHVDGLRVDAVASMLYLDYSRKAGEWVPNVHGGRENLDAVSFLRHMNAVLHLEYPGCFTVAEESTAWPGVTAPTERDGLGFTFKWNMGWMHDTLGYFAEDPVNRRWHHDRITFAMLYEYGERFVMPLSHDEVVHGKRPLLGKMPGDPWQQLANLRLLLTYQYTRPGKQLLFMGTELAAEREWSHERSLDWHLAERADRRGLLHFLEALGRLYLETPCLWRSDPDPGGFAWIDCADRENSVIAYERWDGGEHVVVVLNFTPVPRENYRIGVARAGTYLERLNSDDESHGGSQLATERRIATDPVGCHGRAQSLRLRLPPLGALVLAPEP